MPSYWCIPEEWVKAALELSGIWDDSNDTKSDFTLIDKPVAEDEEGKAYIAGLTCSPDDGMCPYDDMSCVGRLIVKVDPESRQW